jgi:hypothetical protein
MFAQHSFRWEVWVAGALGVLLFSGVALSFWLNSEKIRAQLEQQVSARLGTTLRVGELSLSWAGLRASAIQIGPGGIYGLPALSAASVEARMGWLALIKGQLNITSLQIKELTADLGLPVPESPVQPTETEGDIIARPDVPESKEKKETREGGPRFSLDLQSVSIVQGTLTWPAGKEGRGEWKGFEIKAQPISSTEWKLEGSGGLVKHPGLPEAQLQKLQARLSPTELTVSDVALAVQGGGEILAEGTYPWNEQAPMTWNMTANGIPAAKLVPPTWQKHIAGRVEAKMKLQREQGQMALSGKAKLVEGRLIGLPLLQNLPLAGLTRAFADIPLSTATTEFRSAQETLEITKTELESKGTFRAEGGCTVRQEQLDGTYQLGLKSGWLEMLPSLTTTVFSEERNGYRWTTVRVQGPVASPSEDLSGRIAEAVTRAIPEEAAKTLEQGVRGLRNVLDSFFGK